MNLQNTPYTGNHPTFLLTDIEDSSRIVPAVTHSVYKDTILPRHETVLTEEIKRFHGEGERTGGDGFFAVFASEQEAVDCAVAVQKRLQDSPITAPGRDGKTYSVKVRIGLHTAIEDATPDPQFSYSSHPDVNFAARVMSLASGGQILVSESTYTAVEKLRSDHWQEWPGRWLKSFEDEPRTVCELLWDGGDTRGEPGLRWLPETFHVENNLYVPRPELEAQVQAHFATIQNNGERARMVTLWGYGGMGKTRLAIICALRLAGVFKDGMTFVKLDDRQPSAQSLMEAIGAALRSDAPLKPDELIPFLREKMLLLVLDNYESVHCEETQIFLRDLLLKTKYLRLLVTSREAAHIDQAEKEVPVAGMTDTQATKLFIARAQQKAGRDGWQPTTQEKVAMQNILRLTERHPLALELVAGAMGLREIEQVARELEAMPMPALPVGHIHLDPSERHQSLEKCLQYSYNLLREEFLQHGFAALSLFADSVSVEAVTGACGIQDAQRLLDRLLEKALLTRKPDGAGGSRYAMLRPTRAYAAARLHDLPDATDLRRSYIAYYRQLKWESYDTNDLNNLAQLDREWRNAAAAVSYAAEEKDALAAVRISTGLGGFMELRGLMKEREQQGLQALNTAQQVGDRALEGTALRGLSMAYENQGRWREAMSRLSQSLALLKENGDQENEAETLAEMGIVYLRQNQWQEAETCFLECLDTFRERKNQVNEGLGLGNLGAVYCSQNRFQEAETCFLQSLELKRKCGKRIAEGSTLSNLGALYLGQKRFEEAETYFKQSLAISQEYGNRNGERSIYNNLGLMYEGQSRWQEALDSYEQSLIIAREYGYRIEEGKTLGAIGIMYCEQKLFQKAEATLVLSLNILKEYDNKLTEETARNGLGCVYVEQNRLDEAETCFKRSFAVCREFGYRAVEGNALQSLMRVAHMRGNHEQAIEWGQQATKALEAAGDNEAAVKIHFWIIAQEAKQWWRQLWKPKD